MDSDAPLPGRNVAARRRERIPTRGGREENRTLTAIKVHGAEGMHVDEVGLPHRLQPFRLHLQVESGGRNRGGGRGVTMNMLPGIGIDAVHGGVEGNMQTCKHAGSMVWSVDGNTPVGGFGRARLPSSSGPGPKPSPSRCT